MRPQHEFYELKDLLKRYGLSINWAGKQIGISGAYLSIVLSGKVEASEETASKILDFKERIKSTRLRAL